MSRNKNLAVLSEVEKFALYELPDFDNKQRREYFSFSKKEIRMIMSSPHIQINIFFALQLSYFKAKKIFYKISWSEIPEKDLQFLIDNYFPDKVISTTSITNYQYYNQQKTIVNFFSYRLWSNIFLDIVDTKIVQIIKRDTAPNFDSS